MTDREIAEGYAQAHGLRFQPEGMLPSKAPHLHWMRWCTNAIIGPIEGGPPGYLFLEPGYRGEGCGAAQYEIEGLGEALEGLWVRRSGRSIWTRVGLPRGYRELLFANEPFMASYRVAVSAAGDEPLARELLSDTFVQWLLECAPQERAVSPVATSIELWQGTLYIRGPFDVFSSPEKLAGFAVAAAHMAEHVATVVKARDAHSPRPPAASSATEMSVTGEHSAQAATEPTSTEPTSTEPTSTEPAERAAYGTIADKIESELRALGAWDAPADSPAPDGVAQGAFGWPDRSFTQWLQTDLVPQLRAVAAGREEPPASSMVGTKALREFDGFVAAEPLIAVLLQLDRLTEGR